MNKNKGLSTLLVAGAAMALMACSGGDDGDATGANGEKLGPLRCAELGGSTALLLSKVTGNAQETQSGVGTKSLDSAGSYDENPLTASLFNKVELQTSSGAKALDAIPENPDVIRFYDMDNDAIGQSDDAGDYVFVFAPAKNRPFFLIRKRDNAVLYPDIRPLLPEAGEWQSSSFFIASNSGRIALADSVGNVYVGGIGYYYQQTNKFPLIRLAATDLDSATSGQFVPVSVVSLDGDDGTIELLAADGENAVVAYELTSCDSQGCQQTSRLINLNTGGFRDRPDEFPAFQVSGRAYSLGTRTRTDSCGTQNTGTEYESVYTVENDVLQLQRLGPAGDTVVWEAPECVSLSPYSGAYYYRSTGQGEFMPGIRVRWLGYYRSVYENDQYVYENYSVPALVRESGIELLVNVGREVTTRLDGDSFSSFVCAPQVCLGLAGGRAIGFNPNADDAGQVFEVDGISVRSVFPGDSGVTFDGNELSTGDRVIGVVEADGGFEVKAAIGTEIQQYVPLRRSNTDPVACSTSG